MPELPFHTLRNLLPMTEAQKQVTATSNVAPGGDDFAVNVYSQEEAPRRLVNTAVSSPLIRKGSTSESISRLRTEPFTPDLDDIDEDPSVVDLDQDTKSAAAEAAETNDLLMTAKAISQAHKMQGVEVLEDLTLRARHFSHLSNPGYIKLICSQSVPEWAARKTDPKEIKVSAIMAGLTNQLFQVENLTANVEPQKVLFRIYGSGVGDLYDPKFELKVFKTLSQHKSAPKLIADFPGGRIEEYILGPALLCQNMVNPSVVCGVATILARFHKLQETIPEIKSWPQNGKACMWTQLNNWSTKAWDIFESAKGISRKCIEEGALLNEAGKRSAVQSVDNLRLEEAMAEVAKFKDVLFPPGHASSPILGVGFCHNDVQENNILVTGTRLRLIDFEYSDFNYLAYDIGNFLAEMTIDYCVDHAPFYTHDITVEGFPSDEIIGLFGSVYLSHQLKVPIYPSDTEHIPAFIAAAKRFALASHLVWGFWSVIRAPQALTNTDFDYLAYAKSRFDAYFLWKAHLQKSGLL